MSQKYPHPFSKVAKDFRRFRKDLPEVVSNIALNDFVHNFKRQGYVNQNGVFIPWKGTKKKARRTLGRKSKGILIRSGRLMRSMRTAARYNEARVVSNLPYAKAHNEGVSETVKVRSYKRNRYGKKEEKYKTRSGRSRTKVVNVKKGSGVVKQHNRRMKLDRRPFMITSKTILKETEKHVFNELDKIWNKL